MRVLGVDQSYTSTGWCIFNDEEMEDFGIIGTAPTDGDIFVRARLITDRLKEIAVTYSVDMVGIEGLAFGGVGNATRDLAGLQFLIIDSFRPIPVSIVAPTAVKSLALKGRPKSTPIMIDGKKKKNNKKKELFEALPELIQKKFKEKGLKITKGLYDVVDSYWIGMYTLKKYNF
jgi:hypothetical protein